jgi:hypothetical protein
VWWSLSAASLVVKEGMQVATSQVVTLVMVKLTRDDPEVCLECYGILFGSIENNRCRQIVIQTHPNPSIHSQCVFDGGF